MIINCDTCIARPAACPGCVMNTLLQIDGILTEEESDAVTALADSGLVAPLRYVREA